MSALFDSLTSLTSAAGGGGVIGVIGTRVWDWGTGRGRAKSEAGKVDADAAEVLTGIAVALVSPLEGRISKLEQENRGLHDYIRTLLAWARIEVPDKTPPPPPIILEL